MFLLAEKSVGQSDTHLHHSKVLFDLSKLLTQIKLLPRADRTSHKKRHFNSPRGDKLKY